MWGEISRGGNGIPHREGLEVLITSALWFMRVGGRFRASKAAESRRGENEIIFPPDPPLGFHAVGRAAAFGAALVAEDSFEIPLTRKESSAKSPHGVLWRLRCSRWRCGDGFWGTGGWGCVDGFGAGALFFPLDECDIMYL